jgi:hypothetical protein
MTVETNTKIDAGTITVPAIYANRMQITGHGPIVRLSFGEGMGGTDFHYRVAVAMTINDAKEMAEAILGIVNQAVMTKVEPPKPI